MKSSSERELQLMALVTFVNVVSELTAVQSVFCVLTWDIASH